MTEHTPGPWRGVEQDGGTWALLSLSVHYGPILAGARFIDVNMGIGSVAENEANARLIAAAPELLDALHDTLAHFESIIARIDDGAKIYPADRAALDARFRQARTVLAAAHGEAVQP